MPIPFAFIYWGDKIRGNSQFCKKMDRLRGEGMEMNATVLGSKQGSLGDIAVVEAGGRTGSVKSSKDVIGAVSLDPGAYREIYLIAADRAIDQQKVIAPWAVDDGGKEEEEMTAGAEQGVDARDHASTSSSRQYELELNLPAAPSLTAAIEAYAH